MVAPLEWGLGHATRCIPLIKALIANNCEVLVAAEDASRSLLQEEFPSLTFLHLNGHRMRYSRKGYWLPLKILLQFPRMLASIRNERNWLNTAIKEHKIDAVIS
ncbi:MAG TPA: hypothetical protein VKH37_11255, partial [Ferruginibacter sp.]|nr:hypothetical protein [Ferruginibacter sp.]